MTYFLSKKPTILSQQISNCLKITITIHTKIPQSSLQNWHCGFPAIDFFGVYNQDKPYNPTTKTYEHIFWTSRYRLRIFRSKGMSIVRIITHGVILQKDGILIGNYPVFIFNWSQRFINATIANLYWNQRRLFVSRTIETVHLQRKRVFYIITKCIIIQMTFICYYYWSGIKLFLKFVTWNSVSNMAKGM
jgi:hypothetical protein